jgi:hypothetical protein
MNSFSFDMLATVQKDLDRAEQEAPLSLPSPPALCLSFCLCLCLSVSHSRTLKTSMPAALQGC